MEADRGPVAWEKAVREVVVEGARREGEEDESVDKRC